MTAPQLVVQPAAPVLYFGDAEAFAKSRPRVVTVGLNPSNVEFPRDDPFQRFPGAQTLSAGNFDSYLDSLNQYFDVVPYRAWFGTFEPLLNGMGASYYRGGDSTVLHTDLCSPVATEPTWSRLRPSFRERLIADGRPLWHDLIRILQPDLLLMSVARHHLRAITFKPVEEAREICRLDAGRRSPYAVTAWRIRVAEGVEPLVVFGRAAQRPFGTVSKADKQCIGRQALEVLNG